ncbi:cytochrome P450 [Pelistega sp. MC2]|nr:cytochrome P450 [Pelistega sp. MC2]
MNKRDNMTQDWNPRAAEVQNNQLLAYDKMRHTCPVAYDEQLGYSIFKHADVMGILNNPDIYSNHVSTRHIAVPNGMDGPLHMAFRRINDKYFTPARMAHFEPMCRKVIRDLIQTLPRDEPIEIMGSFAKYYAIRIQNAFMGWPSSLETPLLEWIEKNRRATLKQDREEITKIAIEFDHYIHQLLNERRQAGISPTQDITTELMHDLVDLPEQHIHRVMTEEELISLLRNWTVGELSTISASAGILLKFIAEHQDEQHRLRQHFDEIPAAIEEIMRLEDPLVSNRRRTKCPVHLGGKDIPENARLTINWVSANRDESAFENALTYNPHRDQTNNLVYGAGIHNCPGAPLARLELRLLLEEFLTHTQHIQLLAPHEIENAIYPVAGYAKVQLIIRS